QASVAYVLATRGIDVRPNVQRIFGLYAAYSKLSAATPNHVNCVSLEFRLEELYRRWRQDYIIHFCLRINAKDWQAQPLAEFKAGLLLSYADAVIRVLDSDRSLLAPFTNDLQAVAHNREHYD